MWRLPLERTVNLSLGSWAKFFVQEMTAGGLLSGGRQSRRVSAPEVTTVSCGESWKTELRTAGRRRGHIMQRRVWTRVRGYSYSVGDVMGSRGTPEMSIFTLRRWSQVMGQ